jgi:hypothetical protein
LAEEETSDVVEQQHDPFGASNAGFSQIGVKGDNFFHERAAQTYTAHATNGSLLAIQSPHPHTGTQGRGDDIEEFEDEYALAVP